MPVRASTRLRSEPMAIAKTSTQVAWRYFWKVLASLESPASRDSVVSRLREGSSGVEAGSARAFRRIRPSPSGPPRREPATRPKVAAAMAMDEAPVRPICSSRGAKPPAVPCPPLMGMEPTAIPSRALWPIPRAIPMEMTFCITMRTATRPITTRSAFPPFFRTLKSDWNPTDVKKSIMHKSFTDPSMRHSTPKMEYTASTSSEIMMPPVTGAGMQKRLRKPIRRVSIIPSASASTPTPVLTYISISIVHWVSTANLIIFLPS